jgi:4-amino-4-deoxy-L-arabinose transferase-like glycosyltransferase
MNRKQFLIITTCIVLIAIALRFYKLGQVPTGLYWDEIAMLVDAKSVAQSGQDMHGNPWYQLIFPSYGDYKLPVYIWLASVSVKILGVTEYALRLPSALAGIGTVVIAGLLAKELTRRLTKDDKIIQLTQLATMGVMAVSPWAMMFSRTGFEGHLAQFLVATSLLCVLKSKGRGQWLVVAALLGVLATYTYFSVRFVWPAAFIAVSFIGLSKFHLPKRAVIVIGCLLLYAALLIPMARSPLYEASNRFRYSTSSIFNQYDYPVVSNTYRELAGNTLIDRFLFHRHVLLLRELASNVSDHLSLSYMFVTGDSNLRHGTGEHGLFLITFLPFLFYGLAVAFIKNKLVFVTLIVWWLSALLPASVPESTPHALRSLNALVPMTLFIGLGLSFSIIKLPKMWRAVIVAVILINSLLFTYYYFTQYPHDSGEHWQAGYKEIAQKVTQIKHEKELEAIYVMPFDNRFYLWLMAYAPYEAKDFHDWKSEQYEFKQFDNIYFTSPWSEVFESSKGVLVVGRDISSEHLSEDAVASNREVLTVPTSPLMYEFVILKQGSVR